MGPAVAVGSGSAAEAAVADVAAVVAVEAVVATEVGSVQENSMAGVEQVVDELLVDENVSGCSLITGHPGHV